MDVYIQRLIARLAKAMEDGDTAVPSRESLNSYMTEVGRDLGLIARLEDYMFAAGAATLREALRTSAFLYIGYYFYAEQEDGQDHVYVVADIARQLGQLQYPNSFWVEKEKLLGMEAVRLAGILISLGRPPACWMTAFEAARQEVVRYLGIAMRKMQDDALSYLPENAFVGVSGEDVRSLKGLMSALQRDPNVLWGREGVALKEFALTVFVPVTVDVSAALARGSRIEPLKPPTHPLTTRNHGRPPPTVRWGPPKQRQYKTTATRLKGLKKQAGVTQWVVHGTVWDESDDDFWWNEAFEEEGYWDRASDADEERSWGGSEWSHR